ncbi:hypothetical protein Rsub_05392 [Raphidocelis subcapitata]|uniref:Uncharacterized protein n=1 Tax=Raphidocelis subcapitata TaxID=307507 RepID=A0A2V0P4I9_9CHLO|nr:hypothetical protein Rsub_05392 [Raphidocelis subcapitata]|eukprot:GBF92773.1 hypothetical protein Rsub_05392 [Raphidocelis subcapitata]
MAPKAKRVHPAQLIGQLRAEIAVRRHELNAALAANARAHLHLALLTAMHAIGAALQRTGLFKAAPREARGLGDLEDPAVDDAALADAVDERVGRLISEMRRASAGDTLSSGASGVGGGGSRGGGGSGGSRGGSAAGRGAASFGGASEASGSHGASLPAVSGSASGGGSGGAGSFTGDASADSADVPPLGGVGVSTSVFIESTAAASQLPMSKGEFMDYYRDRVQEAALLAHQAAVDPTVEQELAVLMHQFGSEMIGLVLSRMWLFELFNLNFVTGETKEAPAALWDRVTGCMKFTPTQAHTLALISTWWDGQDSVLVEQREALAAAALKAPDDVELQADIAEETSRLLGHYQACLVPVMVLLNTALLTPLQMAQYYVQAWPYMPVLTPFLTACQRQCAEISKRSAGGSAPRGGGGGGGGGARGAAARAAAADADAAVDEDEDDEEMPPDSD